MSSVDLSMCYFPWWCVNSRKFDFFKWWIINVQIFSLLLRLIWFKFSKYLDKWKYNIACWIFISLRSILHSLNWLCLEAFACICSWVTLCQDCIYWKREYLYSCASVHFFLFLKFDLCLFIFPHLLHFSQSYFSQNLFCFSYFYRGRKLVLKPVLFIRRVITLHRGSCLYFL